jgi:hypothetical protein
VQVIEGDQLIFTSLKSRGSQGYRIVSSSVGADPQEKRRFQSVSPSHQALTSDSENAVGISYYPLATGRYCVAKSFHAGAEPSGRGGFRVYTYGVILDESGMGVFGWNPFNVLYAMSGWEPDLEPPEVLDPVSLPCGIDNQFSHSISKTTQTFDVEWLRHLLECVLGGRRIAVPCGDDPISVARTLLMAIPGSVRRGLSFSAGIRYSLGRQLTMSFLGEPDRSLKRLLLGQPVSLVDLTELPDSAPEVSTVWGGMVEQCWRQRAGESLMSLMGRTINEEDEGVLEEAAGGQLSILAAEVASPEELVALMKQRSAWASESELVKGIQDEFWSAVGERLGYWLDRTDGESRRELSQATIGLASRCPALIDRLGEHLVGCLIAWGKECLEEAARAAVGLAQQGGLGDEASRRRLQRGLFDVLGKRAADHELVRAWGEIVGADASLAS